ncbi:hypothetical protein FD04_GL000424 [Secundilactobacillus odoratitofui DSM 19909 = JCM 15043]|uniref:Uncharacterized protein n=1 Tax=Secundilactobacillus odoratitofui DSM 19909 = JCM 15043 TaxID=1423776 RepID=A0A0R1LT91_9LACO|nr:hypothetical protein [Secundilactobacillus odoratitofui]KRK98688.1 hypothetical protein FD04_GL000424 [Secundilactobacillus odoratitofui DSM 19909 = JCM 15043]
MDWTIFKFLIVVGVVFVVCTFFFFIKKATKWETGTFAVLAFAAFGIAALQVALRVLQKIMS